jgi:hypothetical protein
VDFRLIRENPMGLGSERFLDHLGTCSHDQGRRPGDVYARGRGMMMGPFRSGLDRTMPVQQEGAACGLNPGYGAVDLDDGPGLGRHM